MKCTSPPVTISRGHAQRSSGLDRPGGAPLLWLLLLMLLAGAAPAQSEVAFVLLVNSANDLEAVPRGRLGAMFLKKITTWDNGFEILPAEPLDEMVRDAFCRAVHARPETAIAAYWLAAIYKGKSTPPVKLDDAAIVDFVRTNRGAIAYVEAEALEEGSLPPGVKLLAVSD